MAPKISLLCFLFLLSHNVDAGAFSVGFVLNPYRKYNHVRAPLVAPQNTADTVAEINSPIPFPQTRADQENVLRAFKQQLLEASPWWSLNRRRMQLRRM
ncbi:hypothetical protein L596_019188 [Steinernema carpocapsae]|uniref:Uncharacterized protein n=1 Tax=Steinernema carpocapsae TaxID=34508 RepID=A0A4U5MPH2_STECR|nr:hypothetical protein L596_019188 [Steinernema carpocapsae]